MPGRIRLTAGETASGRERTRTSRPVVMAPTTPPLKGSAVGGGCVGAGVAAAVAGAGEACGVEVLAARTAITATHASATTAEVKIASDPDQRPCTRRG